MAEIRTDGSKIFALAARLGYVTAAMGETDVTFRHLLRGLPLPILRLAFPRRRLEPLGSLDPSVDRPRQRTADSLFRVGDGEVEAAVHVEIEREWRVDLPRRLFEYASAAVVSTGLPVWSVVVLLRPGGRPPHRTGVYRIPGIGGDAFTFRYHVVPLWQLDAEEMHARLGIAGAPFCVAMRGADEAFVQMLVDEVHGDHDLATRDRESTMRLLYVVSAAILGTETARRIFHMEWLMRDPNVRELISEWEDKGRAKEARRALFTVLRARSLRVTSAVRARVDGETDIGRLESWLKAAVTAASIGDVFRDG